VREVGKTARTERISPTDPSDGVSAAAYAPWLNHADSAVVANTLLCLIHQANYLLDQQIDGLERQFVSEGGYSERLATARIAVRQQQQASPAAPGPTASACPTCGKPMAVRTARIGARAGSQFWGCTAYPKCTGTRPV